MHTCIASLFIIEAGLGLANMATHMLTDQGLVEMS